MATSASKPFELGSRIGAGGLSEIFRAESFGAVVAIKRLRRRFVNDAEARRVLLEEGRALAALDHPNCIKLLAAHEGDDPHLVLEYVDGLDLARLSSALGDARVAWPEPALAAVILRASEGLAHAHERGVVHRDLSPTNVLVSREGAVKLIDFGAAPRAELRGTYGYLAPEVVTGEAPDARSDVFSLGVLLWEFLANRCLYSASHPAAVLLLAEAAEIPALDPKGALAAIAHRALAKDPRDRFAHAGEVAAELTDVLAPSELAAAEMQLGAMVRRAAIS